MFKLRSKLEKQRKPQETTRIRTTEPTELQNPAIIIFFRQKKKWVMQKYEPNIDNVCPSYRGVFKTLSNISHGIFSEKS